MHKAAIRLCLVATLLTVVPVGPPASAQLGSLAWLTKLDPVLKTRASLLTGRSRIIVRGPDAGALRAISPGLQLVGGKLGRTLPMINGVVLDVPNVAMSGIASNPLVEHISLDRNVVGSMERTGATIGATAV